MLPTLIYLLLMPALGMWLTRRFETAGKLGPVVFSYGFGLLLSQLPFNDMAASSQVRDLSIPLAIPLLLFSLNVHAWLKQARATVLSFSLCLLALLISCITVQLIFASQLTQSAEIAGMLTALYSGGSPNMAVVHAALELPADLFIKVNAVDFVSGAIYFLFLISLAAPLYGRFLTAAAPPYESAAPPSTTVATVDWRGTALAITSALVIVAFTVALVNRVTGHMSIAGIMLGITTLAIAASFWPRLRAVPSSYPLGYYLVNVFCCAIGSQVDLSQLSSELAPIAAMHLSILLGTIVLHLLFARLAKVDRDTAIITQTAALYGPPFVPPVAGALGNPMLLISGLSSGLVGYAVGNFLGIAIVHLLR